jgi:hypothetical protein
LQFLQGSKPWHSIGSAIFYGWNLFSIKPNAFPAAIFHSLQSSNISQIRHLEIDTSLNRARCKELKRSHGLESLVICSYHTDIVRDNRQEGPEANRGCPIPACEQKIRKRLNGFERVLRGNLLVNLGEKVAVKVGATFKDIYGRVGEEIRWFGRLIGERRY